MRILGAECGSLVRERGGRERCRIFDIGVGGGGGRLREVGMSRSDGKGVLAEGEGRINIESGFGNWF